MKILIFSDSHGSSANILRAIKLHPDAQMLLHLGDGVDDLHNIKQAFPNLYTVCVNGNYEDNFFSQKSGKLSDVVTVLDKKIFMCHGHRFNVSFSKQSLMYAALEQGADIVLYGHTHTKHNEYIPNDKPNETIKNGLYIFNPGSISRPRDGVYPSFGLVEIRNDGILLSHGIIK